MSTTKKRQAEDTPAQPKPKKSKKRKANAPDDELLDTELGLNTLFNKMDNQLLADHLAQKLGRFGTDLSAIEISDMTVSGRTQLPLILPFFVKIYSQASSQRHSRHHFMAGVKNPGQVPRISGKHHRGP
jgi:hypothetical protein